MIGDHIHFETLCALASSGQLTEEELLDLTNHSERCAVCRERLQEMGQVAEGLFVSYALAEPVQRLPKGMCERFVARANSEGIPLKARTRIFSPLHTPLLSAMALLAVVVCIASTWRGSMSAKDVRSVASQAPLTRDADGLDGGSSQREPMPMADGRAPAIRVAPKKSGTRESHKQRIPESLAARWQEASSLAAEAKVPSVDVVMSQPQPKFANYPLPSFSLRSESQGLRPWVERETNVFDRPFVLGGQRPLLESPSNSPQLLAQYSYFPNGAQGFKFESAAFHVPQGVTP